MPPDHIARVSNTYDPNNLNQLQQSKQTLPSGSQTILLYWYVNRPRFFGDSAIWICAGTMTSR
jgi:hypothetical protein